LCFKEQKYGIEIVYNIDRSFFSSVSDSKFYSVETRNVGAGTEGAGTEGAGGGA
jgi:hypothetical protein